MYLRLLKESHLSNQVGFLFIFKRMVEDSYYQELRELHIYRKFGTFTATTKDTKEFLCFSAHYRVYTFQEMNVNLYV